LAKLLIVVDDFVAGGAFKVGERLAHGLLPFHCVTVACTFSPVNETARRALREAGAKTVRLFAHAGQVRRSICDVDSAQALIRRTAPDKILFVDSSPRSNVAIKDVAGARAIHFVAIVNFVDRITPASLQTWDADVARAASAAYANVFVSAAAQADFEANFSAASAPRRVVTNGVPDTFFAPVDPESRLALRREFAVTDDETALLLAGRLESRKGQDIALDALAALLARWPSPRTHLWLAGSGDDDETLRLDQKIRELRLEGVVRRLGQRDDLPQLMDACDIVLMPSQQEADGLVSKEAMAKGRPVIATNLPSLREQGLPDALLIPSGRASSSEALSALVAVLDDLRRDGDKRTQIGAALRDEARRRFTMSQMVAAYVKLLDEMPTPAIAAAAKCDMQAVETGEWMHIGQSRSALRPFKDGWSDVEDGSLWTVGETARLAFRLPEPTSRLTIALDCAGLAQEGRPATFQAWIHGRKIAEFTFTGLERTSLPLRFDSPAPMHRFVVRFRNPHPTSPKALGMNGDSRPLGLRVFAWRIHARPQGAPLVSALRRFLRGWKMTKPRAAIET
jgi:glycosyltransferase involved in cell wall biosynthesis